MLYRELRVFELKTNNIFSLSSLKINNKFDFNFNNNLCKLKILNKFCIYQVKCLGLVMDKRLTWKDHINQKRKQLELKTKRMYWFLGPRSELSLNNKRLL